MRSYTHSRQRLLSRNHNLLKKTIHIREYTLYDVVWRYMFGDQILCDVPIAIMPVLLATTTSTAEIIRVPQNANEKNTNNHKSFKLTQPPRATPRLLARARREDVHQQQCVYVGKATTKYQRNEAHIH